MTQRERVAAAVGECAPGVVRMEHLEYVLRLIRYDRVAGWRHA